jgi:hypothetical protein
MYLPKQNGQFSLLGLCYLSSLLSKRQLLALPIKSSINLGLPTSVDEGAGFVDCCISVRIDIWLVFQLILKVLLGQFGE